MRTIERTTLFRRDYKRETRGRHRDILEDAFVAVVTALASDVPLDPRYRDHPLTGNWSGYRDCHVRPDLVLIYCKPEPGVLQLVRLGSHAELGW